MTCAGGMRRGHDRGVGGTGVRGRDGRAARASLSPPPVHPRAGHSPVLRAAAASPAPPVRPRSPLAVPTWRVRHLQHGEQGTAVRAQTRAKAPRSTLSLRLARPRSAKTKTPASPLQWRALAYHSHFRPRTPALRGGLAGGRRGRDCDDCGGLTVGPARRGAAGVTAASVEPAGGDATAAHPPPIPQLRWLAALRLLAQGAPPAARGLMLSASARAQAGDGGSGADARQGASQHTFAPPSPPQFRQAPAPAPASSLHIAPRTPHPRTTHTPASPPSRPGGPSTPPSSPKGRSR